VAAFRLLTTIYMQLAAFHSRQLFVSFPSPILQPHSTHHIFSLQTNPYPVSHHSFPTRRSSDLGLVYSLTPKADLAGEPVAHAWQDRKSTRLNSSHVSISYAAFCLKKKN